MLLVGLNKTTLLDYPGRVAATIFTGGCNFRCPFCHNGDLVLRPSAQNTYSEEEVLSFLRKRKNVLKGVCISGGEPTLQEDLPDFIRKIRKIGYDVKLDTNGYRPEVLEHFLQDGLIDYVAMDIKNCKEKYGLTVGVDGFALRNIEESVNILLRADIPYEFRTTVVKELHGFEDIVKISEWIAGCQRYFLQQYRESEQEIRGIQAEEMCHSREGEKFHAYEKQEMKALVQRIKDLPYVTGEVSLRGID
ncbi:MAG: anaerobic ribonucleoside-triphosphate reductase activating protein [Lachnospiraceae bacterium]|nr:anaerobic ribonucleoside-triphosphate reductase activating protein [Lachnospiraceae bacterium]